MLPSDPIDALLKGGATAALVFVTWGFLYGPVYAKRTVEALMASCESRVMDRDKRIDEEKKRGDEWQARYETRDAQAFELAEKLGRATAALEVLQDRLEDQDRNRRRAS